MRLRQVASQIQPKRGLRVAAIKSGILERRRTRTGDGEGIKNDRFRVRHGQRQEHGLYLRRVAQIDIEYRFGARIHNLRIDLDGISASPDVIMLILFTQTVRLGDLERDIVDPRDSVLM